MNWNVLEVLKHLPFYLTGGLPSASTYERRRELLKQKFAQHETLKDSAPMKRYRELAAQAAMSRRKGGFDKKEWKQLKSELTALQKSTEVATFFKLQKQTHHFKDLTDWEEVFADDFNSQKLDEKKWITHPSLGGLLPDLLYSSGDESHFFTEGRNLEFTGHSVQLITKREQEPEKGLVFSKDFGFVPAERNFTSAIINTGDSHKQQYGKIEAEIKFASSSKHVYHAVWMAAGGQAPHVNLIRIGSKVEFSSFAKHGDGKYHQHISLWKRGLLRKNTRYILKLQWDKDTMTWFVNGKKMFSSANVIHEPLFIAFSSGLKQEPRSNYPSVLEVEWVKTYQLREKPKL